MGSSWRWEGAWAALAKSSLVAFSSVPWSHQFRDLGFWTQVSWSNEQKMDPWSLVVWFVWLVALTYFWSFHPQFLGK